MSKTKVRAAHRGFLTKIIEEANGRLQDRYSTVAKTTAEMEGWFRRTASKDHAT